MLIDKDLPVSCTCVTDYFFFNSMVIVHIKPTAPHHTTVLTASVKKKSTTRSFTHVISVRLSKNLANSGRFTLFLLIKFPHKLIFTLMLILTQLYLYLHSDSQSNLYSYLCPHTHSLSVRLTLKLTFTFILIFI